MSKLPTCPHCNEFVQKNEPSKKYKARVYHIHCYTELISGSYKEKKVEQEPKEKLYNYMCKMFKIKELTPLLNSQMTKIVRDNRVTYDGLEYAMYYYYELKGNKPDLDRGIAIIPYVYAEAMKCKARQIKVQESAQGFTSESVKEKTVYIKPVRKKDKKNEIRISDL